MSRANHALRTRHERRDWQGQFPFRTRLRSSVKFGVACLLALMCIATALADNNYASTNRLIAVWESPSNILATTSNGMFRAARAEKKWVKLTPPPEMPMQGNFARVPTNGGYLVFVAVGGGSNKVGGIYLSPDEGSSWRLLSKQHNFTMGHVTENGTIFAIADGKILMSTNVGNSWRDLSSGVDVEIQRMISDPDHQNLVCLLGWNIRGYILQADDEQFKWKRTMEWEWEREDRNDDRFFAGNYSTTWVLYNFFATLDNYFNYDFAGSVETGAFRLKTDRSSFTFKLQEPKSIRLKVVFYPSDTSVKFVDLDQGAELWGIKVKTPYSSYVRQTAAGFQATGSDGAKSQTWKSLRTRPDYKTYDLQSVKPYERTMDLDDLFKFKDKGRYKVQLSYASIWIADRNLEEWPGCFTGEVFEVIIK